MNRKAKDPVLEEARRLYKMGFAILWIRPKNKRPVETSWTTGERKPWVYLETTYKVGYNVGVRTGEPSKVGGKFLACIDVDVKEPKLKDVALAKLAEVVGDLEMPTVLSGSGNGSRHLYCLTEKHFKMITIAKSKEIMPAEKVGGKKRVHAWEIVLYSDGRQMVLPPSVHPSGSRYEWAEGPKEFPVFEVPGNFTLPDGIAFDEAAVKSAAGGAEADSDDWGFGGDLAHEVREDLKGFTIKKVDLGWLPLSKKVLDGIVHGTDITDRSSFLLPAATALHSAGLDRDEVLSALTDPDNFLSGCAYDHAQTRDRHRAANWLWKYTVQKVFSERNASSIFGKITGDEESARLSPDAEAEQTAEMLAEINWKANLDRSKQGKLLATIQNSVLILKNDVDPVIVRRNEFAYRDAYSIDTPWGGKKDASLTDDDTAMIKHWLGVSWGFEPAGTIVNDALTVIAKENSFDPVRDWLDQLPAWDGVNRLDTWLIKHFEAQGDPEYLAQVFRKWMTAMVMRVYIPGAKFDWMPIFEGTQGIGKSSFGRVLVGDQYFLDWLPNLGDKDAALGLQGMWAVELGELSHFRKNELETIKAFLTRTVDKFRPPHGRKLIESARRCVFFGTTNKSEYLRDDSGNRRFKPVKVGRLDFEQLREDRSQLFAEAIVWCKKSSELDLELTGQARVYEAQIHQEKMVDDESLVMMEMIEDWVKTNVDFNPEKFRISDLFEGGGAPLGKWRQDTRNLMFASKALKRLGGEKRMLKGRSFWKLQGVVPFEGVGATTMIEDFL